MTAVIEAFETGQWVTIGPNITKAPVGKTARITAITPGGSLIVEAAPGERYVVPPASCTRHEGPPPGRELLPLTQPNGHPPATDPLQDLVTVAATEPTVEPPPAPRPQRAIWHIGDRVEIARDQRDGPAAATVGRIFGFSAVSGYFQVKTDAGVIVVAGEDLAPHIPEGPNRGEREAAERAARPQPEPTRLQRAIAERREQQAKGELPPESQAPVAAESESVKAAGGRGKKRGPQTEEHRQAVRDGIARAKAEREARNRFSDVTVEEIPDPDIKPEPDRPTLRLVERPPVAPPAVVAATEPDGAPLDSAGVDDALRWAIGQGARQRLSVAALRLLVDTLEAVEQEIRR